jgi:hypothetical protein
MASIITSCSVAANDASFAYSAHLLVQPAPVSSIPLGFLSVLLRSLERDVLDVIFQRLALPDAWITMSAAINDQCKLPRLLVLWHAIKI